MKKIKEILSMLIQAILLFILIIDTGYSVFDRSSFLMLINENHEIKPLLMYCVRFIIIVTIMFIIETKYKK